MEYSADSLSVLPLFESTGVEEAAETIKTQSCIKSRSSNSCKTSQRIVTGLQEQHGSIPVQKEATFNYSDEFWDDSQSTGMSIDSNSGESSTSHLIGGNHSNRVETHTTTPAIKKSFHADSTGKKPLLLSAPQTTSFATIVPPDLPRTSEYPTKAELTDVVRTEPRASGSTGTHPNISDGRNHIERKSPQSISSQEYNGDDSVDSIDPLRSPITRSILDPVTQEFREIAISPRAVHLFSSPRSEESISGNLQDVVSLSPWEKWMVRKTKEDAEKRKALRSQELAKKKLETEAKETAQRVKEKAAKVHKEWVERKNMAERAKRRAEAKKRNAQREQEEEKRELTLAKASASFDKWCHKKEEEKASMITKKRELEKEKVIKATEQKMQAEHAYRVWLRTVGCRKLDKNLLT